MKPFSILLLIFFSQCLCGFSQNSTNWWDDPKNNRLIDLADCSLKVDTIEKVTSVALVDGSKITASRRDAQLLLLKVKGYAPDYGKISLNPTLFAVNFLYGEKLTLSMARALGQRGKTPEGKLAESWSNKPEDSYNLVLEKKGYEIVFWVAVEVPKNIERFWVRIPSQIDDIVIIKK